MLALLRSGAVAMPPRTVMGASLRAAETVFAAMSPSVPRTSALFHSSATVLTVSRTCRENVNPQANPSPTKVVESPLDIARGPGGTNILGRARLGPRLNEYERRVSGALSQWAPTQHLLPVLRVLALFGRVVNVNSLPGQRCARPLRFAP
jgi:hypothetical protein